MKDSVEQNPSDEEISNVEPSLDLKNIIRYVHQGNKARRKLLPSQISECGEMQVANHADRCRLLGIIDKNSILGCYGIHHSIR